MAVNVRPQEASSSSSSTFRSSYTYDVFLSFRGKDTRTKFTDHLYNALVDNGIRTFRDDDGIERGKSLKPELDKAIKESKISIIVLSKNYTSSRWCLDELPRLELASSTNVDTPILDSCENPKNSRKVQFEPEIHPHTRGTKIIEGLALDMRMLKEDDNIGFYEYGIFSTFIPGGDILKGLNERKKGSKVSLEEEVTSTIIQLIQLKSTLVGLYQQFLMSKIDLTPSGKRLNRTNPPQFHNLPVEWPVLLGRNRWGGPMHRITRRCTLSSTNFSGFILILISITIIIIKAFLFLYPFHQFLEQNSDIFRTFCIWNNILMCTR
ncbi:hypothetical protein LguiB_020970 [Lonicera macranthoides]